MLAAAGATHPAKTDFASPKNPGGGGPKGGRDPPPPLQGGWKGGAKGAPSRLGARDPPGAFWRGPSPPLPPFDRAPAPFGGDGPQLGKNGGGGPDPLGVFPPQKPRGVPRGTPPKTPGGTGGGAVSPLADFPRPGGSGGPPPKKSAPARKKGGVSPPGGRLAPVFPQHEGVPSAVKLGEKPLFWGPPKALFPPKGSGAPSRGKGVKGAPPLARSPRPH